MDILQFMGAHPILTTILAIIVATTLVTIVRILNHQPEREVQPFFEEEEK